jgi:hypothetical protein
MKQISGLSMANSKTSDRCQCSVAQAVIASKASP